MDLEDTSGTTDKNDFVDILLLDVGILENLLDWLHGLPEEVHVELFELGPGEGLREVVSILEGLNFDTGRLLA